MPFCQVLEERTGLVNKNIYYCNMDDRLFAYRGPSDAHFTYFVVMTSIGVWDRENRIREISYRLTFDKNAGYPDLYLVKVIPGDEGLTLGTVTKTVTTGDTRMAKVGGSAAMDFTKFFKVHIGVEGRIERKNQSTNVIRLRYPYREWITQGNKAGTDAFWKFAQGNAAGKRSQYDLNVFFKMLKHPVKEMKKWDDMYWANPKVSINNHELTKDEKGKLLQRMRITFLA